MFYSTSSFCCFSESLRVSGFVFGAKGSSPNTSTTAARRILTLLLSILQRPPASLPVFGLPAFRPNTMPGHPYGRNCTVCWRPLQNIRSYGYFSAEDARSRPVYSSLQPHCFKIPHRCPYHPLKPKAIADVDGFFLEMSLLHTANPIRYPSV